MSEKDFWLASPRSLMEDWRVVVGLAGLLAALYLPGIGAYGLYDPWETHYGEVARNMVETHNYIDPFWGSPWDPDGVKREREGFYSKPPLIMWMMAAGMNVFGFNELGVRALFPVLAIMALLAIYLAVSRFYHRRAGLIAAGITGMLPIYSIMSRQAVTDGPMVSIMIIGVMSLLIGLFYVKEDEKASSLLYWSTFVLFLSVVLGQLWIILALDRSPDVIRSAPEGRNILQAFQFWISELFAVGRGKGWVIALALSPLGAWAAWRVARQRRRRMLYIYIFYIACGLTVPAKGWLAWAPMGGAILGYMVVTGEWRIFKWVDVPTGLLIVFMTGHPWTIAMLGGHHPEWYKRFWVHDHQNRLFAGVHSIDDGGFEYFFKWIGYGMFPWIGLLPGAIARVLGHLRRSKVRDYTVQQKFEIFVFIWAIFTFFLFTKSSTKFHHYIFPGIPPLAILTAIFFDDLISNKIKASGVFLAAAGGITLWVGQDLFRMPGAFGQGSQNLVNLFTYKYDREWPEFTAPEALKGMSDAALKAAEADNAWLMGFSSALIWITAVAIVGYLALALFKDQRRLYGAALAGVAGLWMTFFCLDDYLPKVAVHWSQAGMWAAYYEDCARFGPDEEADYQMHMLETAQRVPSRGEMFPKARCREPIIAFRTNWRGECYHSANTVLPAPETKHLKPFLDQWGLDKPFYLFTERHRVKSELEPALPKDLKGRYTEVFGQSLKFVLLRIDSKIPKKNAKKRRPSPQKK
ncbi:glycosyltransferase family 39 protein [Myxococcota bacterium]|nr:glycosyltransferase family 39 protein [Myxococcota bacterium]MBU1429900.1 glycosyltransferase family 39 protein [Myxococcota bacterium]MBU1898218.1 glycosyltransferase family 39 protein [Myxococcota bacterium]